MNTDLFNAILAMDAYNRGYNAGINFGENSDAAGTVIGTATVLKSKGDTDAQAASFYAIAYKDGDETIIAYRGTDSINPLNDPYNGWGVGLGHIDGAEETLAFQFYNTVAGTTGVNPSNITLTGHS